MLSEIRHLGSAKHVQPRMSALGQKQTRAMQLAMSAKGQLRTSFPKFHFQISVASFFGTLSLKLEKPSGPFKGLRHFWWLDSGPT